MTHLTEVSCSDLFYHDCYKQNISGWSGTFCLAFTQPAYRGFVRPCICSCPWSVIASYSQHCLKKYHFSPYQVNFDFSLNGHLILLPGDPKLENFKILANIFQTGENQAEVLQVSQASQEEGVLK